MDQQKHTTEDTLTDIFGSKEMRSPAPTEFIPKNKTAPEIAYQLVKDETYPQTQPRLNLATFVTTYMDDYATRLMNEAININYIDETEYPRVAVMCGRCLNIVPTCGTRPKRPSGKPARWASDRPKHACWAEWPHGCAGERAARPQANPSTNPTW